MAMNEFKQVKVTIDDYLKYFPGEGGKLKLLKAQLVEHGRELDITDRSNYVGHVTASAFIVDKINRRVLLLNSERFQKHLQTGGHLEAGETPLAAARRLSTEKTNLSSENLEYYPAFPGNDAVPFDIDTHYVHADSYGVEKSHQHHDFRYLFLLKNDNGVNFDIDNDDPLEWVPWDIFMRQDRFSIVSNKIDALLTTKSPQRFFSKVAEKNKLPVSGNTICVAVMHIIPSSRPIIQFLHQVFGENLEILAKPKSIDASIFDELTADGITIRTARRGYGAIDDLGVGIKKGQKVLLVDIGGYFVGLSQKKGLPIVGIIEDTENGLQKYLERGKQSRYPVISVARSELKKNEDELVGESVVCATDSVLRLQNILIDYMQCGIIGYGKVGAGIAKELQKKNIVPNVCETNATRLLDASRSGCKAVRSTHELTSTSEVIFCATGSGGMGIQNFRSVKNGTYIASVTSSDDEFDFTFLDAEYDKTELNQYIAKYTSSNNYFYLINDGNAVNFLFNAAIGNFMYLVHAEFVVAIRDLLAGNTKPIITHATGPKYDAEIAELWLDEFVHKQF